MRLLNTQLVSTAKPEHHKSWLGKVFPVVFVLIVFAQNPPWPFWELQAQFVAIAVMLGLLLTIMQGGVHFYSGHLGFFAILSVLAYFFFAHGFHGQFRLSSIIFALTVVLIFRTQSGIGAITFRWISYTFSAVLLSSLFFWGLWQFGLSLPSTSLSYGDWKGHDITTQLDNYYFFISRSDTLIKRFYGVFDEPGVVGTLAAFILCGLRFDFSLKRSWVMLLAGLFSWSLAFIVLTIIGFYLFKRGPYFKILLTVGIICGVLAITANNIFKVEDSAMDVFLYRIANFSEHGISSRTGESLNEYFIEFLLSSKVFFGEGTYFFQKNPKLLSGQGAIFYLVEYGVVGMALLLLIYISLIKKYIDSSFQGYLLLMLFIMSFLQRPHLMTPWQVVMFWSILCAWQENRERIDDDGAMYHD